MSNSSHSSDNETSNIGGRSPRGAIEDRLAVYSNAADRLLEIAEHGADLNTLTSSSPPPDDPGGGPLGSSKMSKEKDRSLEEKLLELHVEESLKERLQWSSHLNPCSNLLSLLCRRERCHRLLFTLYPNDEGYAVALASKDDQVLELAKLSYEDDDLLTSIDNQELPSSLVDLLDFQSSGIMAATDSLFYNGCIVAEIRDERRVDPLRTAKSVGNKIVHPSPGDVSHVLLRPTTQSIICDSNLIARQATNGQSLISEERSILEGQLVLATQPPLCLDPNPVVSVLARKAVINRQKFATVPMRRYAKKFSQVGINRKRKLESQARTNPPDELKLHEFILSIRDRQIAENKMTAQEVLIRHQNRVKSNLRAANALAVAAASGAQAQLSPLRDLANNKDIIRTVVSANSVVPALTQPAPLATDVSNHARAIPKRVEVNDNTPHVVEEYILETAERGTQRIYHTRLTIFQRLSNDEYLGELYVERDYRENDKKGSTCRFVLGTRPHALRYINQFTEIFTEEGRKSVKITHQVPNQPARITLTPGMKERMNERHAAISAAQAATQGNLAASSGAADVAINSPSVSQSAVVVGGAQATPIPTVDNMQPAIPPTVPPQLTTLTAPRRMPTSSILQATLSAPPVNSSSNNSSVSVQQQLPIHPVPPSAVIRQIITPNAPTGPPPGILQTQLTIQTNNLASNSTVPLQNQTTVMLPLTPHPNPHSASSSSLASPQQPLPTTPIDGQGSIAVAPSNILPSPISMSIDQTSGSTSIITNNNVNSVINNLNTNSNSTSSNTSNNSSNGSGNNNNANHSSDQIAISAIMESLMKDTAQFEAEKKQQRQLQSPQPPQSPLIANSSVVSINSNNLQQHTMGPSGAQLIGGAQLPTCPVPQASLAEAGVVTSPAKQIGGLGGINNQTNRVSLQNLLSAQIQQHPVSIRQIQQQQQPSTSVSPNVKVTISQLAAQLQRPSPAVVASVASVCLPSYSQALAQAQQISPGQRLVLAQQPSLSTSRLQRSNHVTPTSNTDTIMSSPISNIGGSTITLAGKTLSQDAPGLQALLANTPSADNPCLQLNLSSNDLIGTSLGGGCAGLTNPNSNNPALSSAGGGSSVGTGSLLERLVTGQPITTNAASQGVTNMVNSSVLSPIARSLPNPVASSTTANIIQNNHQHVMNTPIPADSTNDITLATLLAKPVTPSASAIQQQGQNNISPAKMSPLLQQLQQPIPPPRPISNSSLPSPRQHATGITSPRRPPTTPSPSRTNQPSRSPRPSPTNFGLQQQSPRPQQSGPISTLQQHLMQPPNKQNNSTSQQSAASILSTQLQQPLNVPVSQVPIPVQELVSGGNNSLNTVNVINSGIANDISNHPHNTITPNGLLSNGSQQQSQVVSLQNLLQSGVVQVSNVASSGTYVHHVTQTNTATASIPVQLSIPGLSTPVTLSVNLPATSIQTPHSGTLSNEVGGVSMSVPNSVSSVVVGGNSVLLANQGSLLTQQGIGGQQKAVNVSTVGGKLVANNHSTVGLSATSAGGVLLQGSTGNIIHLPQQPQQFSAGAISNVIKPIVSIEGQPGALGGVGAIQSNHILKSIGVSAASASGCIGNQVLQVRQAQGGQQVYVQVPNSSNVSTPGLSPQSIHIVRSIPQGSGTNPQQQQTIVHTVQQQPLRPPSLPPPSPQQQLVTLNSALKSPVGLQTLSPQTIPPQSPINNASLNLVMSPPTPQQQQLMGAIPDPGSLLLTSPGGGSGGIQQPTNNIQLVPHPNAAATTAAAHIKIRQQRKQSLK